jgi:hypothetical protein
MEAACSSIRHTGQRENAHSMDRDDTSFLRRLLPAVDGGAGSLKIIAVYMVSILLMFIGNNMYLEHTRTVRLSAITASRQLWVSRVHAATEDAIYVAAVLTLNADLPDTPLRPSPMDQSDAHKLYQGRHVRPSTPR